MVDFVEEVEEELRAERYASLARRVVPWIAAALGATVVGWLGVWGYDSWTNHRIEAASVAYDKAMVTMAGGDPAGAFNAFAPIAKDGPPAYKALALMQQANIRLGSGARDEAVGLFDAAGKAAPKGILADLAELRAAQTMMDSAPFPQIETKLTPLIGPKKPFNLEARELLAMARLQSGQFQAARGDFNAISLTLGVPQAMRARDQAAIALIDSGEAGLLSQVVKAAATLPPPTGPIGPGALQAGPGAGQDATQAQQSPQTDPGTAE